MDAEEKYITIDKENLAMPILKRGYIYFNENHKHNNYVKTIAPVFDIEVTEKMYKCFAKVESINNAVTEKKMEYDAGE